MEIQSIIISGIISLDINLSGDLIALLTIKEQKYEILIYHYIEEEQKFREKYKFFPIIEKNQIINEIRWGNEEFSLPLAYKTDRTIYIYEESENKMEFQSKIEIELEKIISF